MYNKQAFESGYKGGCGPKGRGEFGGRWGHKFGGFRSGPPFGRHAGGGNQPPVNIEETDEQYIISLFAAALIKENVTLSVKNDVLTISYQGTAPSSTDENKAPDNYTYQEHQNRSFERSFRLNDKVLTEGISASYADGVLKVVLPKNPETNKPAQIIPVG